MERTGPIPKVAIYRGVGIHDFQPAERIEAVVKPAIDAVYGISDPTALVAYASQAKNPPEARLFAAARCEAAWQLAAEGRVARPNINIDKLRAIVVGLDSLYWINPNRYTSLLDTFSRDALEREARLAIKIMQGDRQPDLHEQNGSRGGGGSS
ncbi:hypothetical protein [Methylobacterium durans]|uniref:Uncharacterized protein n=1 Tax=Methylobacterium durans TaxID=2202825 RepID=A0A2U8WD06_9HYPH|nr:hypothetical protein [Methylobacterium durans]AWN43481.1 hypothetical protein DK389_26960 [Methylobacterium durans]